MLQLIRRMGGTLTGFGVLLSPDYNLDYPQYHHHHRHHYHYHYHHHHHYQHHHDEQHWAATLAGLGG